MAIKERKQITGTTAQISAYEGHEGQIVWDKEKKTFVGMSGTAGKNYPLAQKSYVDSKEDKGTCLPKSGGTLLGGYVSLQSPDGSGTAQFLRNNSGEEYAGVDIPSESSNWDNGAVLSLRLNDSVKESGSFHLRTGKNPNVYFLMGKGDGSLSWKGNEIVRTGVGNRLAFSIGASGAHYTAPVTGRCVIAGGVSGPGVNGGTVELHNSPTLDQMATGITPNNGWMRGQINVRKGDIVSIYYYNWDRAEAFWIEQ